jgi:hypothetical protein
MVRSCQVALLKFYMQFYISRGTGTSTSTGRLLGLMLKLASCNTVLRKHATADFVSVTNLVQNSFIL